MRTLAYIVFGLLLMACEHPGTPVTAPQAPYVEPVIEPTPTPSPTPIPTPNPVIDPQFVRAQGILELREELIQTGRDDLTGFTGDVWIVAGQSNGVSPCFDHTPFTSQKVWVTDFNQTQDPLSLFQSSTTSIAFGLAFEQLSQNPVAIVNIAVGSTSTRDWLILMKQFQVLTRHHVKGVLWVQGENDEHLQIPASETYDNMVKIVEYSRQIQPNLPWFVALDKARVAQQALIDQGVVFQGPDVDALRDIPNTTDIELIHFAGQGLDLFAQAWVQALTSF